MYVYTYTHTCCANLPSARKQTRARTEEPSLTDSLLAEPVLFCTSEGVATDSRSPNIGRTTALQCLV